MESVTSAPSSSFAAVRSRVSAPAYGLLTTVAAVTVFVIYFLTAARVESFGSDTSTYFGLAESLRHLHAYRFDFEPHVIYPPGYPALLAALMAVVGDDFAALVRLSIPIYFIGLAALYWLVKLQRGAAMATVLVVLAAVSGDAYFWTTVGLHSDVPYFTVSLYALLCVVAGDRAPERWQRVACSIAAALLLSYLVLLRSIGVTLVGGVLLWIAYPLLPFTAERRGSTLGRARRWLLAVVLPLAVMAGWSAWTRAQGVRGSGDFMDSYGQQFLKADPHQIDSPNVSLADLPRRVARMSATRVTNAFRMAVNAPPVYLSWYNPVVLAFGVIVLVGFASVVRQGATIVECYMVAYGALLVLYPFDEGTRYLLPVLPFIALYGTEGVKAAAAFYRRLAANRGWLPVALGSERLERVALALLLVGAVGGGVARIATLARVNLHPDPTTFTNIATVRASDWLREHTRPGDVIMNDEWAILHRLTDRKTIRFPLTTDAASIAARIAEKDVAFVVVLNEKQYEYFNPSTMRRFATVRQQHPTWFTAVHVFHDGTIYRVQRGPVPTVATTVGQQAGDQR